MRSYTPLTKQIRVKEDSKRSTGARMRLRRLVIVVIHIVLQDIYLRYHQFSPNVKRMHFRLTYRHHYYALGNQEYFC